MGKQRRLVYDLKQIYLINFDTTLDESWIHLNKAQQQLTLFNWHWSYCEKKMSVVSEIKITNILNRKWNLSLIKISIGVQKF